MRIQTNNTKRIYKMTAKLDRYQGLLITKEKELTFVVSVTPVLPLTLK